MYIGTKTLNANDDLIKPYNKQILQFLLNEEIEIEKLYTRKFSYEFIENELSASSYLILSKIYKKIIKKTLKNNKVDVKYLSYEIYDLQKDLYEDYNVDKIHEIIPNLLHMYFNIAMIEATYNNKLTKYTNLYKYFDNLYTEIFVTYQKYINTDKKFFKSEIIHSKNIEDIKITCYLNTIFSSYATNFINFKSISSVTVNNDILALMDEKDKIGNNTVFSTTLKFLKEFKDKLESAENEYNLDPNEILDMNLLKN